MADREINFNLNTRFNPQGVQALRDQLVAATREAEALARALGRVNLTQGTGAGGTASPRTNPPAGGVSGTVGPFSTQSGERAATAVQKLFVANANLLGQQGKIDYWLNKYDASLQKLTQSQGKASQGAMSLGKSFMFMLQGFASYRILETVLNLFAALPEEMDRAVDAAARWDRYQRSFTALLGDRQAFGQVVGFARRTPFSLEESIAGSQRLIATGMQWKEVIPTLYAASNALSRIGDVDGTRLPQLIKALTDVQAKGKLAGQEIIQFANAGVDILSVLAQQTGKTRGEMLKLSEAGQVGGELVLASFRNWSRAQGDFLAQQSQDYLGVQQNLEDVRFELEAVFGESAMKKRTAASKELLEVLQSRGAHETADLWGQIGGAFTGTWDRTLAQFVAGRSRDSLIAENLNRLLAGQTLISWEEWNKAIVDTNDALAGTKENLTDLLKLDFNAQIDQEIDALKKRNDQLRDQRNLQNEINNLLKGETDLNRALHESLNILSPDALTTRGGLMEAINAQYERRVSFGYSQSDRAAERKLAALEAKRAAGQPLGLVGLGKEYGNPLSNYPGFNALRDEAIKREAARNATAINPWMLPSNAVQWLLNQVGIGPTGAWGRAGGGPVGAGGTYVVGENGPELLHMGGSGYVSPNGMMAGFCPGCGERFMLNQIRDNPRISRAIGRSLTR